MCWVPVLLFARARARARYGRRQTMRSSNHDTNMRWLKILIFLMLLMTPPTLQKRKRVRHSGRLLGRPNPSKCSRRPKQLSHSGHFYFVSEDTSFKGHKVGWLDARNLCRERCMDLVSIETFEENMMIMKIVHERGLRDVWTSGRLCNFHGCDAKHLQPKKINGKLIFWGLFLSLTRKISPSTVKSSIV